MEINCKITCEIPKKLIAVLGITEDTSFETYFENGAIHFHPLTDEELEVFNSSEDEEADDCTGNCEDCDLNDCCPYDEDETDYDCIPEGCKDCQYFCHRYGCCTLEDDAEEDN